MSFKNQALTNVLKGQLEKAIRTVSRKEDAVKKAKEAVKELEQAIAELGAVK